jgi:hypothetical protein
MSLCPLCLSVVSLSASGAVFVVSLIALCPTPPSLSLPPLSSLSLCRQQMEAHASENERGTGYGIFDESPAVLKEKVPLMLLS